MVIGFDRFREAFQDFAENYIVIGGSACDWLFTSLNAQFRATKDIDLVVIAERMSPAFAAMIWEFVRAGGYSAYERKDGKIASSTLRWGCIRMTVPIPLNCTPPETSAGSDSRERLRGAVFREVRQSRLRRYAARAIMRA